MSKLASSSGWACNRMWDGMVITGLHENRIKGVSNQDNNSSNSTDQWKLWRYDTFLGAGRYYSNTTQVNGHCLLN